MSFQQRQASRKKAFLKIGFSGPSGSGKTMSALKLARGMASSWEKVTLIDTENGSGELYSHLGPYQVISFYAPFTPERYIEVMDLACSNGAEVVVIDGISHEWSGVGGILEFVDHVKKTGRNSYGLSPWMDATPKHNNFITSLLQLQCHTIVTNRTKTEWHIEAGKKPEKIGTQLVQRDGFEYELTTNFEVSIDHKVSASKDRTGLFSDGNIFLVTEKIGEQIKEWNESGAPAKGWPKSDELNRLFDNILSSQIGKSEKHSVSFDSKIVFEEEYSRLKFEMKKSVLNNNWEVPEKIAEGIYSAVLDWEPSEQVA